MSDPITIGAGLGAGLSVLSGKSPLKGAALGGLGGAGYGALTGSGMAGNLLSKGGLMGAGSAGTVSPGVSGATQLMGSEQFISPFTPQGVLGTQTVTPGLTGAEQVLGQAGQQAMAQSAPLYTGSQGMMDTGGGMFMRGGVSAPIPGAEMSGGGYGTLDRVKDVAKDFISPLTNIAEENPRTTQLATGIALQNMLQPQPGYQMPNIPPSPTSIPSRESVSTYVPASLRTQVARNVDPRLQSLYGYGRG
jgi:hypothetical protein